MIEFAIPAHMRYSCLKQFVDSIRQFYDYKVIIAEDSGRFTSEQVASLRSYKDVEFHQLETDVGLSAKRNFLLTRISTPYFIICDEDHIIIDPEMDQKMLRVQKALGCTIVSGGVDGVCGKWYGYYTYQDKKLALNFYSSNNTQLVEGLPVTRCRFVPNFYLGKTEDYRKRKIRWDDKLKLSEHIDFFIRFPKDLEIYHISQNFVKEIPAEEGDTPEYKMTRYTRLEKFKALFRAKYGLSEEPLLVKDVEYDWTQGFPKLTGLGSILI